MSCRNKPSVRILSIIGEDVTGREVDLRPILDALGDELSNYSWVFTSLDCSGLDTSDLCDSVYEARRRQEGVWVTGDDLAAFVARVTQTIEANLLAFPEDCCDIEDLRKAAFERGFVRSKAVVAIEIRDGNVHSVISKNPDHIERIMSQFPYTSEEDPASFGIE